MLVQVNLKSCCVVPEELSTFAKENKVGEKFALYISPNHHFIFLPSTGESMILYRLTLYISHYHIKGELRSPYSPTLTLGSCYQEILLGYDFFILSGIKVYSYLNVNFQHLWISGTCSTQKWLERRATTLRLGSQGDKTFKDLLHKNNPCAPAGIKFS